MADSLANHCRPLSDNRQLGEQAALRRWVPGKKQKIEFSYNIFLPSSLVLVPKQGQVRAL